MKKNVNLSQVIRLHRRSLARAEEVREAIVEQNKLTENAKNVLERAAMETHDYKIRAEKAQIEANNSKCVAEQAKVEAEEAKKLEEKSKHEIVIVAETESKKSNLNDIHTANVTKTSTVNLISHNLNESLPLECVPASKIKGYPLLRPVGK